MMKAQHQYMIILLVLTLFFIAFIFSGSLLWRWQYPRGAIICFILSIPTIFGQLVCVWQLSRFARMRKD